MSLTIDCKNLRGKITVPYSKSMAHRYLIASFLSGNYEAVKSFDETNMSDDVLATKECLEELISGEKSVKLNCRESGTTLRFMTTLVAALGIDAEIKATGTLAARPMDPLLAVLKEHGVIIEDIDDGNTRVFKISGKIKPGKYKIKGNISSQFISSLLLTLPVLDGNSEIEIECEIASKPYIELTLQTLEKFGVDIKIARKGYAISGNQNYNWTQDASDLLEADWSQASLFLVANSILGTLEIDGLNEDSLQADAFIQDIIEIDDDLDVIVSAMDCPDLVPAISLWALSRTGKTTITDLERLKYKESNRLKALSEVINNIGGDAKILDDTLVIVNKTLTGTTDTLKTYNDHRMVMFCTFASILTETALTIDAPESVKKSYPYFFDEIERLGGTLKWN